MIAKGEFREDLFYRLNVVPVTIPPLRARGDDAKTLARHFVIEVARSSGRANVTVDEDALALLALQPWPGNVRQLQNFIERLVVLAEGSAISDAEVDRELGRQLPMGEVPTGPGAASLDERRKETERAAILEALDRAGKNRSQAARLLGISRRTLYNKLEELGLA
jgi:DNA-binding NtrC family response regulator